MMLDVFRGIRRVRVDDRFNSMFGRHSEFKFLTQASLTGNA